MERTCKVCGNTFKPNANHQKYCSSVCKNRVRWNRTIEQIRAENESAKQKAIELYDSDFTVEEIAKGLNKQPCFIYTAWKEAGLPRRKTSLQKQVEQLIDQGLNYPEIAEKLGKDRGHICDIAERIGKKPSDEAMQRAHDVAHQKLRKDEKEVRSLVIERIPGFEFYGNYTGANGRADIKCLTCGSVITRNVRSIRKGHVVCDVCEKNKQEIRERLRAEEQRKAKERADEQKRQRFWACEFDQISMKQCPVCRGMFVSNRRRYCSDECAKTVANQKGRDRRLRKIKNAMIDSSITLDGLIKRDGNICYLCGCECDRSDFWVNDNGIMIAGDSYPSIDHVIPLSKGGLHEWSNVKLAHRRCNYLKRDEIIPPHCLSV